MKNFLIVFPCDSLAYSPTIINMISLLSKKGNVRLVSFSDKRWVDSIGDIKCSYEFINFPLLVRRLLQRFPKFYSIIRFIFLYFRLRNDRCCYDLIFGIDSLGYFVTKINFKNENIVYLSLEVYDDVWLKLTKLVGVGTLLIQSDERKKFLFGDVNVNTFILPNSPICDFELPIKNIGYNLIYIGGVYPAHGVEFCIETLYDLEQKFSLTVKGMISPRYRYKLEKKYAELLSSGRLILDDKYVSQSDLVLFLRNFDAGLCFYDTAGILKNDFNYISCPSGKMYSYFAAGLPVIGQDILGMRDVLKNNAGILVENPCPKAISSAVQYVFKNYKFYSKNAIDAGKSMDFKNYFDDFYYKVNC